MPNRLQHAKSPYLLQHADNPVDWYPWGEEAFEKARELNKPVFLSIGYATCHWCHVMAHESFEDPEIADLMNEAFINVKVDREERPDIDSTYMTVCQMLTGQGGWPLTIVMTPEKEPFFAGTYIPKEARFNRIGLRQLIPGISGMWKNEPKRVDKATAKIREGFVKAQDFEQGPFPGSEAVHFAAEQLAKRFDDEYGGFGDAPKFPSPHNLMFLLRHWKMTAESRFLESVTTTLRQMRLGGIWDHIGYGFHRYSTDRKWLLPHFEKMLYDQALLMLAYTEGWQAEKDPLFKQTVMEIAEYVDRSLGHKEGGFYAAEDADSEGEEGKFYVWSGPEIDRVLNEKEDADQLKHWFGFQKEGNFREEATGEKTGKNIPHLNNVLNQDQAKWFQKIRPLLYQAREERVKPLLDDKILTDWNALMIAALAKASFVFEDDSLLESATRGIQFIEAHLVKDEQTLYHRYRDGEAGIDGMADDYSFLIFAYLELYQATFDAHYLSQALHWNEQFHHKFWDPDNGGYYLSVNDEDQVFGRQKQVFDGAIPSSNSMAMMNLMRLSRLTGNTELEQQTEKIGKAFSADLIRSGASITQGMQALQFIQAEGREVSLLAPGASVPEVIEYFRTEFQPFTVLHHFQSDVQPSLAKLAPYTAQQVQLEDQPTLYICRNFSCDQPLTDPKAMLEKLNEG